MRLVIADKTDFGQPFEEYLCKLGHHVQLFRTAEEALFTLQQRDGAQDDEKTSLFFLDADGNKKNYPSFVSQINALVQAPLVIIMTASPDFYNKGRLSRYGAYISLDKRTAPKNIQEILSHVTDSFKIIKEIWAEYPILGTSKIINKIREKIRTKARRDESLFLEGEPGTGKENIARHIWAYSDRNNLPLQMVNCSDLRDVTQAESKLFGHERGAFTGAHKERKGRFKLAHGGILFLDEIGDLHSDVQPIFLRALGNPTNNKREIDPLGSEREEIVDVRIITATNKDLAELVKTGRFRQDLHDRLNYSRIHVPAIRDRREDIPEIVDYYFRKFCKEESKAGYREIEEESMCALKRHDWPGNVREITSICQELAYSRDDVITLTSLPSDIARNANHPFPEILRALKALARANWNYTQTYGLMGDDYKLGSLDTLKARVKEGYLIYLVEAKWSVQGAAEAIMANIDPKMDDKLILQRNIVTSHTLHKISSDRL